MNDVDIIDSTTPYYQVYKEEGVAKALNVRKNTIDCESSDHISVIRYTLNNVPVSKNIKEKISLTGDFIVKDTIKIPSYTIFQLNGSITLDKNVNKPLVQEADTIKGTTQIEMLGGTYDANKTEQTVVNHAVEFKYVTRSYFFNLIVQNCGKDCFVLDTKSKKNLIESIITKDAGIGNVSDGNGCTDRGEYNIWIKCIAENNFSDCFAIKSRYSEYRECIGRYSKSDVGFGLFADRLVKGNKLTACRAYGNATSGVVLNNPKEKKYPLEDNFIQGAFYDNGTHGLRLMNSQSEKYCNRNKFDVLLHNNGKNGFDLGNATKNSGVIVTFDNKIYDANIDGNSNKIDIYVPDIRASKIKKTGDNDVEIRKISCSKPQKYWSIKEYCNKIK